MSRRQELCRNFQRGSCKYGAQCRFVHASSQQQQQAKPNPFGFGSQQQQQANPNPFGFGSGSRQQQQQSSFGAQFQQQQQQKPNPFGFGVQGGAAAQSRNAPGPAKPFQNKWVRDPSAPTKQQEAITPQTSQQPSGSLQGSSMSSFGNFPKSHAGYQQPPASSSHHRDIDRQSQDLLSGIVAPTSAINQAPVEDNKNENQDDSIWLKEKWSIGEVSVIQIPLGEPPQRHISHVF
uniref:Zinc finger CCCH domain-containing protein n=1 Tax=Saccharum hybrid cultivar R570 TaxID=131158 RepID=A0A059Q073_9POAL|nr:zinc finger CCCH domain-containing protein [Saccharum hybrid cultivar R570]